MRVLMICGSPGEDSHLVPLASVARRALEAGGARVDELDLDRLTTAELGPRWAEAHAVLIVAAARRGECSGRVRQVLDQLPCAYRVAQGEHLAGAYGLVLHGDVRGVLAARSALSEQLDQLGLIDAGEQARFDRFIGDDEHGAIDFDDEQRDPLQHEARCVAEALLHTASEIRERHLRAPDKLLRRVRPVLNTWSARRERPYPNGISGRSSTTKSELERKLSR